MYTDEMDLFMQTFEISDHVGVQYVASFYFITTIITTIGFGDIVPENTASRIFCILVMYMGAS